MTTLGQRIREHRRRAGLSQEALARRMDVSRQAVTKWESGQSAPSTENLFRLAELFGTTVDLLLPSEGRTLRRQRHLHPCGPGSAGVPGSWRLWR